jgi:hypothetical protein
VTPHQMLAKVTSLTENSRAMAMPALARQAIGAPAVTIGDREASKNKRPFGRSSPATATTVATNVTPAGKLDL